MANIIQSVRGTRDFYPEQMAVRNWLSTKIREVSEAFGYQEYDGPFLERLELYAAKSGEELVRDQAYVFPDRGGEEIALRPELTPSLARMIAQRQGQLVYPVRWWSFGPFWRYEKPQKGRTREFFQWNIDHIGINSIEADAEIIAIAATFLQRVGLNTNQVSILVNDRKFMETELASIGVDSIELRKRVFQLIDRKDKLSSDAWRGMAAGAGLALEQITKLEELLSNKGLWEKSESLRQLFELLDAMAVRDYVQFEPQIIRGLDYYTSIVFEAKTLGKSGRAILGGGHYDNLVEAVGGNPLTAVGFAMGDVMISVALEEFGLLDQVKSAGAQIYVSAFEPGDLVGAYKLASQLRDAGFKVITPSEPIKFQKQLKFADREKIPVFVIQGPDEKSSGKYTIKSLARRSQTYVDAGDIIPALRAILAEDIPL